MSETATATPSTAPSTAPSILAVVSGTNPVAIWHVVLVADFGSDRLSGAWLVDPEADVAADTLRAILTGTAVLPVSVDLLADGVVKQALTQHGVPVVDAEATVAGIRSHIAELKQQVKDEKAKPGREKLTDPRFPKVSDIEPIPFEHVGEPVAGEALAWARGVEKLVAEWAEVESQRKRRKFLIEPWGKDARNVPLVYREQPRT